MMLPVPFTSIEPSPGSFHFASPPLAFCHFDRSLPSNRTIASDGGGPGSMTAGSFSSLLSAAAPIKTAARPPALSSAATLLRRRKAGGFFIGKSDGCEAVRDTDTHDGSRTSGRYPWELFNGRIQI